MKGTIKKLCAMTKQRKISETIFFLLHQEIILFLQEDNKIYRELENGG